MLAGALLAAFPAAAMAQANGITDLSSYNNNGQVTLNASAVSGDGNVLVGFGTLGAFRWTSGAGLVYLGFLNGGHFSIANGANSDGSVVVGSATDSPADTTFRAFRWTQAGGMVSLGIPSGGIFVGSSGAAAVSSDGSVVVGSASDSPAGGTLRGFRWTQASGMVLLGVLNGGSDSHASGVNSDGSVIVGGATDGAAGNLERAFRWTQSGGMVSLGVLNPSVGAISTAAGVSSDGNVVVGTSTSLTPSNDVIPRAFRWTQSGGMVGLGTGNLIGVTGSGVFAVNSDGSVIVGNVTIAGVEQHGFRWTQTTGMQTVDAWLQVNGVTLSPSLVIQSATGVSGDGTVVVGNLSGSIAYIARVAPPASGLGSGMITLQDFSTSLSGNTAASVQAASMGSLVLNGAHSRPLARRVEPGKSCVWTSGDFGRDDHSDSDGRFGLAEVGGCHAFAPGVQGSISVGRTWSGQDLVLNGKSDVRTTYGIAELLGNMTGNLWASGAVLYQDGDADAQRGYFNAGVQDFSRGRPGVQTTALRLRLDWEDAGHFGKTTLTPYVDASYARARIGGYTEGGGGFPASFDARTENATELRVGADAAHPLSSNTKLLARFEGAHRFETTGASTSGTVLGLFSFNLPGQQIKRDWLRFGAGVESRLGPGVASAMLNATTQGSVPSYWLNVSYQVAF